ncbi:hypothetical protein COHA_008522 [Chlorella ohadii]|uniref:Uncharacterized protein n=1 Tax=Chlorella ohadii TaxID=2649997 RepID=A0AAD5DL95_9CHLO|nr:hypothetical protein COHA_008522 [Chlorella ohadii]
MKFELDDDTVLRLVQQFISAMLPCPALAEASSCSVMKFELDDDTVLRLSGVATAAYSATLLVVPRTSHDIFYVAQTGSTANDEHIATARWFGAALACDAATTLSVGLSEASQDAKRNALRANGLCWLASGGMHLYNAGAGVQKKDVAYSSAALAGVLGALCLWRGFRNNDDDAKEL